MYTLLSFYPTLSLIHSHPAFLAMQDRSEGWSLAKAGGLVPAPAPSQDSGPAVPAVISTSTNTSAALAELRGSKGQGQGKRRVQGQGAGVEAGTGAGGSGGKGQPKVPRPSLPGPSRGKGRAAAQPSPSGDELSAVGVARRMPRASAWKEMDGEAGACVRGAHGLPPCNPTVHVRSMATVTLETRVLLPGCFPPSQPRKSCRCVHVKMLAQSCIGCRTTCLLVCVRFMPCISLMVLNAHSDQDRQLPVCC